MDVSEGQVTTPDGIRLFYRTIGSGPRTVVVPNGFHLLGPFEPLVEGRRLVFYDVRNRGRSDAVTDPSRLARGIHNDVDDLEAVRRHFGLQRLTLVGHSYMGLMVILYAMKHPAGAERIVQIGPMQPDPARQYPAHLMNADPVGRDVFARLGGLQKERAASDPIEFCRRFWSVLRTIYVTDPADAEKVDWGRCDLPNERNFMTYWMGILLPSIQALRLEAADLAKVRVPVLTLHGAKDRSAPYGGGRDWALRLPNARLVTLARAGHAPWIEEPERVFDAITTFLDGDWPESAAGAAALAR